MSLAYIIDREGRYQVAYESMDKISIFKVNQYTWMWFCPCCDVGLYCATRIACVHLMDKHLNKFHPEEE